MLFPNWDAKPQWHSRQTAAQVHFTQGSTDPSQWRRGSLFQLRSSSNDHGNLEHQRNMRLWTSKNIKAATSTASVLSSKMSKHQLHWYDRIPRPCHATMDSKMQLKLRDFPPCTSPLGGLEWISQRHYWAIARLLPPLAILCLLASSSGARGELCPRQHWSQETVSVLHDHSKDRNVI